MVSVLKDASAAIYGGGSGVILVIIASRLMQSVGFEEIHQRAMLPAIDNV